MNMQFIAFYNQNEFGDVLLNYRRKQNITQEELAEMLDVSIRTVSKWEQGRIPCTKNLNKVLNLPDFKVIYDNYYKERA